MKDTKKRFVMVGFRLLDGFVRFSPGPTSEWRQKGVDHDQEKNPGT
jgi:hypothetical protein